MKQLFKSNFYGEEREILYRFFKQKEEDKISSEILNEMYPVEHLQKYYKFAYAHCLSLLTDTANKYINGNYADKLDAFDLKLIINELASSDKELKGYYERLRKDGIKTKMEEMKD